jgi:hypothetical protein
VSKPTESPFQKFRFTPNQIIRYTQNAQRDLKIAQESSIPEVRFTFGYQSLIKAGITLLAGIDQAKVRSTPGHHVKILDRMSQILRDPDIFTMGNVMRMKRNTDFYGSGENITEKEAEDYLAFIELAVRKVLTALKVK